MSLSNKPPVLCAPATHNVQDNARTAAKAPALAPTAVRAPSSELKPVGSFFGAVLERARPQ